MNNFEQAVMLSCNSKIATYPNEFPQYEYSKKHKKKMKSLLDKMRNDKYHKLTRKVTRAIIVAAIIMSLAVTAFAIPDTRKYIVKSLGDMTGYSIGGYDEKVDEHEVSYLPNGFALTEKTDDEYTNYFYYENPNGEYFSVTKQSSGSEIDFDNEHGKTIEFEKNGIKYIRFGYGDSSQKNVGGYVWNYDNTTYCLSGNLPKDAAFKVVLSVK